jgi:hypothetical protein
MESVYRLEAKRRAKKVNNTIDTSYVLFFLAVEFGNGLNGFTLDLDNVVLGLTMVSILVLPFWLNSERKSLSEWVLVRGIVAISAIGLGVIFRQNLGTSIPEIYGYLPMTFVIISGMLSVYFQFYSFLKLRIVK